MAKLGLERSVVDTAVYERTARRFGEAGIVLPTIGQLADPRTISDDVRSRLGAIDPDSAHPLNLFRVHWYNAADRRSLAAVPEHVELPEALTGVKARIVVALGNRFPMINAHKVLAAYGCLAPRLVTGQFDPTHHRAVWPSTGNYCRGGVAISKIMGCRGVAVLPENMSRERFDWLERWVTDLSDIIRTPGSESNVKEIYDACAALDADEQNIIFNQFCEFGNYLIHRHVTGPALAAVFESVKATSPDARLRAFTSATGSAGTIAAGDHLKQRYGTKIVAVEALECPTLLYNGFGEHNIQGIGDKHVPFIHNVMNTDIVTAVSDHATDTLGLVFNTGAGRAYLAERRGLPQGTIAALADMGLSAVANIVAAIKTAKYYDMGPDDVVVTVATDGAAMYGSEWRRLVDKHFGGGFDQIAAAEAWGAGIKAAGTDHLLEMSYQDRNRVFNLGYFTWVEQQGVSVAEFEARRDQRFWDGLSDLVGEWDELIRQFNAKAV
jgi:cysteine synthase